MQHVSDNTAAAEAKHRKPRQPVVKPSTKRTAASTRKSVPKGSNNNSASATSAKRAARSARVRVSAGGSSVVPDNETIRSIPVAPAEKRQDVAFNEVLPQVGGKGLERTASKAAKVERGPVKESRDNTNQRVSGGKLDSFVRVIVNAMRRARMSRIAEFILGKK